MKRFVDVFLSVTALVLLLPFMLVLAVAVRLLLGSPVLFRQMRPGFQERPFQMAKFRTMTNARNAEGGLLPDDQRLTRFGLWMRSCSLDELPELWHVLRGDMSLVGPRPLLMQYLTRYNAFQRQRHEVKPGITGWAQINGRNALDWNEKFAMDVWYVENRSLALDLNILVMTLVQVILRRGISQEGHATASEFAGSVDKA